LTRRRLPLILVAFACLAVPVACGSNDEAPATVDGQRIEREDVDSLIELYKGRAEAREGEAGEGKEGVSHAQEVGALQVLVERAVLEQKAEQLGIRVDAGEVERRAQALRGRAREPSRQEKLRAALERTQPTEERQGELEDQFRATARAQVVLEALYKRVTRNARVERGSVLAYYRSHRSAYSRPGKPAPKTPPPEVEHAIARGLTATQRDNMFARWRARVRREAAPKIRYENGWAPQDAAQ
jgi:SurA-like protein